jgi:GNAT superfamily N-acetyltransferase
MVAPVAGLLTDAALPDGVRLQQVVDAAGVELVVEVHTRVFGDGGDRMRSRLLARLADDPDTLSMVVAVADGEPVCAARMEFCPGTGFAGLWGGGTLPAWRGKGIYRALVAHRAREAAAAGYQYLQVDASDLSRPILERLGFAVLSTTTPYLLTP